MSIDDHRVIFIFETVYDRNDCFRVIIFEMDDCFNKSIVDIMEFDITDNFDSHCREISKMIRTTKGVNEFTKIQIGYSLFSGVHFHKEHDVSSARSFNKEMREIIHLIKMGNKKD